MQGYSYRGLFRYGYALSTLGIYQIFHTGGYRRALGTPNISGHNSV